MGQRKKKDIKQTKAASRGQLADNAKVSVSITKPV